jgi:hypothetical protein
MFEYVASGLSFLRCNFKDTHTGFLLGELNKIWSQIRGQYDHEFSFLYNAYIEKHFGEVFYSAYRGKGIKQVYADSGGLQIVTQGLTITPALKQKVYESQAMYSDCAMSFDEIPVSIIGTKAVRSDISSKYFDRSKFEWCARESGRNVKNQIETFINMKSDAKPMFIVQGGDLDTYIKWCELALEEIPKEYHERIGGVAMGSGGIGNGMLEDCKRAFYYTQTPLFEMNNHLHLLGIGAVSRMVPTLAMIESGFLVDKHISYDSTTHTSGVQMGRYYGPKFNWVTPGKHFINENGPQYSLINADIKKNVPFYDVTDEFFHEVMNISVRKYQAKTGDPNPPILAFNAYFASSTINFLRHLDTMRKDFSKIHTLMSDDEYTSMMEFSKVKSRTDFERWEKEMGKYLPSQAVRDGTPATLPEDF